MERLARDWIDGVVLGSPVAVSIGARLLAAEVDSVAVTLPFLDGSTTTPGVVHGGIVATLIDIAGAAASASGIRPEDAATGGATSHLAVDYLAPAAGELRATAEVVFRSRSATLADVRVTDSAGALVATGRVTSRIFH